MRTRIKFYEVEITGSDEALAALKPVLDLLARASGEPMMGGEGAPPQDAIPGPSMQPEAIRFLAAHGFTPAEYERGRERDEDIHAFVARRELEQAGIKFTRVVSKRPCSPTPTSAEVVATFNSGTAPGEAAPAGWSGPEQANRDRIRGKLAAHGGNYTQAARALGMSRSTLVRRAAKYGLRKPSTPAPRGRKAARL